MSSGDAHFPGIRDAMRDLQQAREDCHRTMARSSKSSSSIQAQREHLASRLSDELSSMDLGSLVTRDRVVRHVQSLERALEVEEARSRGLESDVAFRDQAIADLRQQIANLEMRVDAERRTSEGLLESLNRDGVRQAHSEAIRRDLEERG